MGIKSWFKYKTSKYATRDTIEVTAQPDCADVIAAVLLPIPFAFLLYRPYKLHIVTTSNVSRQHLMAKRELKFAILMDEVLSDEFKGLDVSRIMKRIRGRHHDESNNKQYYLAASESTISADDDEDESMDYDWSKTTYRSYSFPHADYRPNPVFVQDFRS